MEPAAAAAAEPPPPSFVCVDIGERNGDGPGLMMILSMANLVWTLVSFFGCTLTEFFFHFWLTKQFLL